MCQLVCSANGNLVAKRKGGTPTQRSRGCFKSGKTCLSREGNIVGELLIKLMLLNIMPMSNSSKSNLYNFNNFHKCRPSIGLSGGIQ